MSDPTGRSSSWAATRRRAGAPTSPASPPAPPDSPPTAVPVPEDSPPTSPPAPPDSQPPALWFSYRIAFGHLALTAPEHERPVPAVPGSSHAIGTSLACVYAGLALTTRGPEGLARQLVLDGRERFFLDAAACAAAGPLADTPGPDELRPLGCASALADPATRARLAAVAPARDAVDPAAQLRRQRRIFLLRRDPTGAPRCEAWRHRVGDDAPQHGVLARVERDERGAFTRAYAYEAAPGFLTLRGPTEVWHPRVAGRRAEAVRARGCLVTRAVIAATADAVVLDGDPWFLSRRACEAARTRGVTPPPPHPCL